MNDIAFHFFTHNSETVIAFRKQWYNGNFIKKKPSGIMPLPPPGYTTDCDEVYPRIIEHLFLEFTMSKRRFNWN